MDGGGAWGGGTCILGAFQRILSTVSVVLVMNGAATRKRCEPSSRFDFDAARSRRSDRVQQWPICRPVSRVPSLLLLLCPPRHAQTTKVFSSAEFGIVHLFVVYCTRLHICLSTECPAHSGEHGSSTQCTVFTADGIRVYSSFRTESETRSRSV